jgi:putative pyruvate formate lyase activating enzyme
LIENCTLCGHNCGVNRLNGNIGFCNSGKKIKLARVSLHHWEEPCLSGDKGSGTIFFSNCNLKCVYCQNYVISSNGIGKEISIKRLSEIFLEQQEKGAHNINLVTPTHFVPQIIEALKLARTLGLSFLIVYIPIVTQIETIKAVKSTR